jgi:hypothetical protein
MRERTRERLKRPGASEALTSKDVRPALPSARPVPATAEPSPVAPGPAASVHPTGEHLPISEPGDALEQEAGRMAGRVVRAGGQGPAAGSGSGVQRSGTGGMGSGDPPTGIRSRPLAGEALPGDVRAELEPRFGHDFSKVRVHTDAPAADSARALNALAYTVRSDIVFGAGQFAPHQAAGRMLLAHELAHVVQQDAAGPRVQRQVAPGGGTATLDPGASRKTAGELVEEDRKARAMQPVPQRPTYGPGMGDLRRAEAEADPRGATVSITIGEKTSYSERGGVHHSPGKSWPFSADQGFARRQLREIYVAQGMAGVDEVMPRVNELLAESGEEQEQYGPGTAGRAVAQDHSRILSTLRAVLPQEVSALKQEVSRFQDDFGLAAELVAKDLVTQSKPIVEAEAKRYGYGERLLETQIPVSAGGGVDVTQLESIEMNQDTRGMQAAAAELSKKHDEVEELKEEQKDKHTFLDIPLGIDGRGIKSIEVFRKIKDQSSYDAMTLRIQKTQMELDLLRFEKEQKYPNLASFTSRGKWSELKRIGKADQFTNRLVAKDIGEKLQSIRGVERALAGNELKVWKYGQLMDLTRQRKGVQKGTHWDRAVTDKMAEVKGEDRLKDMFLSFLALALALVAAPFTGGGSLLAAGAMLASAGIGAYLTYEHIQQYQLEKAAEGMAFDRAKAISMEEPSLFWLALAIVGTALDIHGALAAFRVYRTAAKEMKILGALPEAQKERLLAMLPEKLPAAKRLELLEELSRRIRAEEAKAVIDGGVTSARGILANPADTAAKEALEKFLKENIQSPRAMHQFYQELGWENIKALQGKIDERLFSAIHWSRDQMLASMWGDVQRAMLEKGVKLRRPYVGAPPLSRDYKLAYSDVDFSVQVEAVRGADGRWRPLTDAAAKAKFEIEAKALMEKKLAGMVPASAPHLDVNVYMQPGRLPLAATGVAEAGKEALTLEARETRVMQYYEARMGFGPDKAGAKGWNELRERALAEARKQGPEAEKEVLQHLSEAEGRYADYQGRVAQARTGIAAGGKHDAETLDALARKEVREDAERELKDFLNKDGALLDHPGREGEMARARYNALQLKVRSTWEEAYVGHAAAGWGAAGPDAGKVLAKMSEEEIRAAKISQASYIVQWGKEEDAVVRAWKCAKYDLRDATFEAELAKRLGKSPRMAKEWEDFLKSLKASKTPDEAWAKWKTRFGSDEAARAAMDRYVAELQEQTKGFLAKELGSVPGAKPSGPAGGTTDGGPAGPPSLPPPKTGGPPSTGGPGPTGAGGPPGHSGGGATAGGAAASGEWGVSYVTPHGETVIIDSNTARAIDKEFRGRKLTEVERKAQKLVLDDREKLMVKAAEARGADNLAVVSRSVEELAEKGGVEGTLLGVRHRPIPQAERDAIMKELEGAAVGGKKGVADREIVLQSLYSETAVGRIPQVMSADDQFINGLARMAARSEPGMNPAKLGKFKNIAEYLRYAKGTDAFTVTIQGRELRVIPVQPIRPDLK